MAPTKAELLKNKRTTYINQLSRLREFVTENGQTATLEEVEVRMASLERIYSQFEGVQGKLEETEVDEESELVRTDFEVVYYEIQPILSRLIRVLKAGEAPVLGAVAVAPAERQGIRLPDLSVPKFSGDTTKWLSFIETFMSLVDRNPSLSNGAKFQHLLLSVSGPAAKIIESIELNDANYQVALALLRDRYDNRTLIAQEHIKQLFTMPPVEKNSGHGLRDLIDTTRAHIRALQTLGRPVHHWDDMIVYLITTKLDFYSLSKWQQEAPTNRQPSLKDLLDTLSHRCLVLENTAQSVSPSLNKISSYNKPGVPERRSTALVTSAAEQCIFCVHSGHIINRCNRFRKLSPSDRYAEIKKLKACINCLRIGHFTSKCSQSNCGICSGKHHSLLHIDIDPNSLQSEHPDASSCSHASGKGPDERNLNVSSCSVTTLPVKRVIGESKPNHVFLATAMTIAFNKFGQSLPCRVLLDSASQLNFITERMASQLRLPRESSKIELSGVGGIETAAKYMTFLTINSRLENNFSLPLEVHILPQITGNQPDRVIDVEKLNIPDDFPLADPNFNSPQNIDLLIGSEHFFSLLSIGQFSSINHQLVYQNTVFGWVVSGKTSCNTALTTVNSFSCCVAFNALIPLDKQVRQFWEIEEAARVSPAISNEETECVRHFNQNVSRSEDGRYVVRLPFRRIPDVLGKSQFIATKRFYNLEGKLARDPELKIEYTQFVRDYLQLGHMEKVDPKSIPQINYFMPHHCVLKPDSSSTRLRVVFDASAKSTSGNSLNDLLMVGPTVQSDIFSIILRFRFWQYVFIADIAKMYRQILVSEQDQNYQYIVWRNQPNEELQIYKLKTITYGTSSAPFLATQTLNKLAADYADEFPGASKIIRQDCYVDDIMTGSNSLSEAVRLQGQLIALLHCGGFKLKKWCANHNNLLSHLPPEDLTPIFRFRDNDAVKTLGLIWEPTSDHFIVAAEPLQHKHVTKRTILADTMKIFDPLGLVSPVVAAAKIFLQHLWKQKLAWDDSLSEELKHQWLTFRGEMSWLMDIKFNRHILINNATNVQLHAFSDASEKALAAAIYIRSTDRVGNIKVALLCSKSRVAPTKSTTLPKLELCAAQLTVELTTRIIECCDRISEVYYWTDSTVALAWIGLPAYTLQTFVANRVAFIQENSNADHWYHVRSNENPADLPSRGMNARNLVKSEIWFDGPKFLSDAAGWTGTVAPVMLDIPEQKIQRVTLVTTGDGKGDVISNIKFCNSFQMTINVIAYCRRFSDNCLAKVYKRSTNSSQTLDVDELNAATVSCVRCIQHEYFGDEIAILKKGGKMGSSSTIKSLCPFLDEVGVLRVGGRLRHAKIPFNAKHPMMLPKNHPFTSAMINHYHRKNFHAGPQSLLAAVRQQFWPIHGKELVKKLVRKCFRCSHAKPVLMKQMMGDLPHDRVQPERPFTNVGVDFMGPFWYRYQVRVKKSTKGYVAIFICFWSKAIHLEVVSDLTTGAFLAALKRFVGRRGRPSKIFSDNATNFVGAKNELAELRQLFMKQETQDEIKAMCAQDGIRWYTIPPRSPHFGGLWEAAVKSTKFHLKRQFALASLTLEELTTCMVQIEAILNSRPLMPLSTDPNDFDAITAGHFLIGGPLTAPLEPKISIKQSLSKRWHRISLLHQQVWPWFMKTYLHQLQERHKWTKVSENIKLNSLVLLQDENLPPLKWLLGRVIQLHVGRDNLVRVATIKTATGTFKRAVTKIALLPEIGTDNP